MKNYLRHFDAFLREAEDPSYYQETFYFNVLLSLLKERGGSRDETKNDIRALPEVLTVTLIEPEKGGVQRDIGTKYLTSLKLHVRLPKGIDKSNLMKAVVNKIQGLTGVSVLRYQERKPRPRRTPFRGSLSITEGDYYQSSAHAKDVMDDASELIGRGPQDTGGDPFKRKSKKKKWKSAPPLAPGGGPPPIAGLEEEIKIRLRPHIDKMLAFDIQPQLNQHIWEGDEKLHPDVREALLGIAQQFIDETELEEEVTDIIFTGSLANYNWSRFSDIDMHILVDFAEISDNTSLVRKFFDAVKSNWNKLHDITIKDHEVEIYVQDEEEPHVSTGVYSILKKSWVVKPKRIEPHIDKPTAVKKARDIQREIDKITALHYNNRHEEVLERSYILKDKIKRMRRAGLARTGLFSPENLAFKMLRRSGHIQKLFDAFTSSYDAALSLDEGEDDTNQNEAK
jgi:predicted nucleotidyltransferase